MMEPKIIHVEDLLASDDPDEQLEGQLLMQMMEALGIDEIDSDNIEVTNISSSFESPDVVIEQEIPFTKWKANE